MEKIEIAEGEKIEIIPDIIGGTFTSSDENIVKITKTGDNAIIEGIGIGDCVITYDYTDKFQCVGQAKLDITVMDGCIEYFPKDILIIPKEMIENYTIAISKEVESFSVFINPYYLNKDDLYEFEVIVYNVEDNVELEIDRFGIYYSMTEYITAGHNKYTVTCTYTGVNGCSKTETLLTCEGNQFTTDNIENPRSELYDICGSRLYLNNANIDKYDIVKVIVDGIDESDENYEINIIDNGKGFEIISYTDRCFIAENILIFTESDVVTNLCYNLNIRNGNNSGLIKYFDIENRKIDGEDVNDYNITYEKYEGKKDKKYTFEVSYYQTKECFFEKDEDFFLFTDANFTETSKLEIIYTREENVIHDENGELISKNVIKTYQGDMNTFNADDCGNKSYFIYKKTCPPNNYDRSYYPIFRIGAEYETISPDDEVLDFETECLCEDEEIYISDLSLKRKDEEGRKIKFYYNTTTDNPLAEDYKIIFQSEDEGDIENYNKPVCIVKDEVEGKTKIVEDAFIYAYFEDETEIACSTHTVKMAVKYYKPNINNEIKGINYKQGDTTTYNIYDTNYVLVKNSGRCGPDISNYVFDETIVYHTQPNDEEVDDSAANHIVAYLNEDKTQITINVISQTTNIPKWFLGKDAISINIKLKPGDYNCSFEETITFKFNTSDN